MKSMYKLSYLPAAVEDLTAMVDYISSELFAPESAYGLLDEIERAIGMLAHFPYTHPLFQSPFKLPREVRIVPVKRYPVFYVVLEPQQEVEIQRVLYDKVDRSAVLWSQ